MIAMTPEETALLSSGTLGVAALIEQAAAREEADKREEDDEAAGEG